MKSPFILRYKNKALRQSFKSIVYVSFITFFFLLLYGTVNSQAVTDSVLQKVAVRFKGQGSYKLEKIIPSVNNRKDGLPPDAETNCLSGKEMLVVAVFGAKPANLFARMLVTKHYNKKIAYDEHPFQKVDFDWGLGIYYALVQVAFPAEANSLNCSVNLQVYDKANPTAKVWLLVLSK